MKEPVDHILRPRLPWRDPNEAAITECGYDASKVTTLSRTEFFQRVKDFGQQRTAMLIHGRSHFSNLGPLSYSNSRERR